MTENATTDAQVDNREQEAEDTNQDQQQEAEQTASDGQTQTKGKSANYIKRLQSEKAELSQENEELKRKFEEIAQKVYVDESAKKERAKTIKDIKSSIPKTDGEKLDEVLEKYPQLDPLDALKLVKPDEFVGGKQFQIQGAVKSNVGEPKKPQTQEERDAYMQEKFAKGEVTI